MCKQDIMHSNNPCNRNRKKKKKQKMNALKMQLKRRHELLYETEPEAKASLKWR